MVKLVQPPSSTTIVAIETAILCLETTVGAFKRGTGLPLKTELAVYTCPMSVTINDQKVLANDSDKHRMAHQWAVEIGQKWQLSPSYFTTLR